MEGAPGPTIRSGRAGVQPQLMCFIAATTFSRRLVIGLATFRWSVILGPVAFRAWLICATVLLPHDFLERIAAMAPATCGAAMDVPAMLP
jgi:hypothetical protein